MDIYILHEGEQSGPYSGKTVSQLLDQGTIATNALAWRNGMSDWLPVEEVLAAGHTEPMGMEDSTPAEAPALSSLPSGSDSPASSPTEGSAASASVSADSQPATAKQKALLSFLHISLPANATKDQASRSINDAMEDQKYAERLTLWNEERLRLHPELFAGEIQAKKENRASHFFELCQTTGAEYFNGISKAHCQVLVSFLDVKFPHWDAREADAAEHYFFPAVAEKFPQLVQKQWRGRLNYAEGGKVAAEIVRHSSSTSKLRKTATSPIVAITRGVVLGVVILAALYLGHWTLHRNVTAAPAVSNPGETAPPQTANLPSTGVPDTAVATADATVQPSAAPAPAEPVPPASAPTVAAASEPMVAATPVPPPGDAATSPLPALLPVTPDPAMSPAPMAGAAPGGMGGVPPLPAADPAGMALTSTAVATAPMAVLPGSEPPVPLPPPPATMPTAGTLPMTPPAAPEPAAMPTPAVPPVPGFPEAAPPAAPVAKINLLLTKPVEIQLTYGKIKLPPGTPVKLVSRQGAALKVSYRDSVITVPATSTDLE